MLEWIAGLKHALDCGLDDRGREGQGPVGRGGGDIEADGLAIEIIERRAAVPGIEGQGVDDGFFKAKAPYAGDHGEVIRRH